jgi:alkylation response protein AidB-like acyl-CoA dehydrogenase
MQLMNWQLVDATREQSALPGDASAAKVFATETAIDVYRALLEVRGASAMRITDQPWRIDSGRLALMNLSAQINTFGGGVAEVQREIVAWSRLEMARRTK